MRRDQRFNSWLKWYYIFNPNYTNHQNSKDHLESMLTNIIKMLSLLLFDYKQYMDLFGFLYTEEQIAEIEAGCANCKESYE